MYVALISISEINQNSQISLISRLTLSTAIFSCGLAVFFQILLRLAPLAVITVVMATRSFRIMVIDVGDLVRENMATVTTIFSGIIINDVQLHATINVCPANYGQLKIG